MTDGRCTLCGDTYTKQGMTRHLLSCKQEHIPDGDEPTFHLSIGDAYRTDYWMHIEIEQETALATLDEFLRDVWLECCGHMSSFTIVDLGLVDGISIDEGDVTVHLLPTNQLCMYIPHMTEDIENRVGDTPEIDSIIVETVADEVWTQDRMTEEAYEERKEHFQERVEEHGLTPAYDGEKWIDGFESGVVNEK